MKERARRNSPEQGGKHTLQYFCGQKFVQVPVAVGTATSPTPEPEHQNTQSRESRMLCCQKLLYSNKFRKYYGGFMDRIDNGKAGIRRCVASQSVRRFLPRDHRSFDRH